MSCTTAFIQIFLQAVRRLLGTTEERGEVGERKLQELDSGSVDALNDQERVKSMGLRLPHCGSPLGGHVIPYAILQIQRYANNETDH